MAESIQWYEIYQDPRLVRKRWKKHERKYTQFGLPAGKQGLYFLDLCCGNGEFSRIAAMRNKASTVVGMDLWPVGREHIPDVDNLHFVRSSAHVIAARANSFDHVFIFHSLHHLGERDEWQELVDELKRVLKPGGQLHLIDHYSSFWLKAVFFMLRMPLFRLFPQTRAFSEQLVIEKQIVAYWLKHWKDFLRRLTENGFENIRLRKTAFFFYASYSKS